MDVSFHKYEGAGNDFVLVTCEGATEAVEIGRQARAICDRHFGIGADGLVLLHATPHARARMIVFNADGSRADMCGNALRCVGRHLLQNDAQDPSLVVIETDQGPLAVARSRSPRLVHGLQTEIGRPKLERAEIPMLGPIGRVQDERLLIDGTAFVITALFLGNPHAVVFVDDVDGIDLSRVGPAIETHPTFPHKINVNFVQVLSRDEVRQRTWERGVGETLACGTGASSVCVAGVITGRLLREVLVHVRGGDLLAAWPRADSPVLLTGPARLVFQGTWNLS